MRQDERPPFDLALRRARESAYPRGEFVGQESFMCASEILSLAGRAGVGPGVRVLDLCCGVAGPGRLISQELGCTYLGVDASSSAVDLARERAAAAGLPCRFVVAEVPPVPGGRFEVALLLETMLAFPDKDSLLRGICSVLSPGGRLAFTLEEGQPLTATEAEGMPDADTVWLTPWPRMLSSLQRAGLRVRWSGDCSRSHLAVVDSMIAALSVDARAVAAVVGDRALEDLLAAHARWSGWLRAGRVRKLAIVAERVA